MSGRVIVRVATPADAATIAEHVRRMSAEPIATGPTAPDEVRTVDEIGAQIEQRSAAANSTWLLACEGDALLGEASLQGHARRSMRHTAVLGISVRAEARGRGIGDLLLRTLIAWAPGAGVSRIELHVLARNTIAPAVREARVLHRGRATANAVRERRVPR